MCNTRNSHVGVGITCKNDQALDGLNFWMVLRSKLSFEDMIAPTFLFNVLKRQFDQTIGSAVIDFVMTPFIMINNQISNDV